jgi:hypothetical protein
MVSTFFLKNNIAEDQHDGICNLVVLHPIIYKKYFCKMPKILHMYVKCTPHPWSLDDTILPTNTMSKEFGFSKINSVIANALNWAIERSI